MKKNSTPAPADATALVTEAWQDVGASFERFCLSLPKTSSGEDSRLILKSRHDRGRW
jgi:hypothetical protein